MNLQDLGKAARHIHAAIGGGREQVRNLRDSADATLNLMDAIQGVSGQFARKPTLGTAAGVVSAVAAHFTPDAPTARPLAQPPAPKRVKATVVPPVKAAPPAPAKPAPKVDDVIDAEWEEGVIDPRKPHARR
jgi:hypothetical protein